MTGAVLGTIPTAFLYFSTYEWCKERLAARGHSQVTPLCAAFSCLATLASLSGMQLPGACPSSSAEGVPCLASTLQKSLASFGTVRCPRSTKAAVCHDFRAVRHAGGDSPGLCERWRYPERIRAGAHRHPEAPGASIPHPRRLAGRLSYWTCTVSEAKGA